MVRSRVYGILAGYEDQIGITGSASACVPPSRWPFPIRQADPLDSPLRRLPQVGVRGRCASAAGPDRCSVTGGLGAPGRLPCREGFE
jgi:hypothetical protein